MIDSNHPELDPAAIEAAAAEKKRLELRKLEATTTEGSVAVLKLARALESAARSGALPDGLKRDCGRMAENLHKSDDLLRFLVMAVEHYSS